MPRVLVPGLFRMLPALSTLPRLMEGNSLLYITGAFRLCQINCILSLSHPSNSLIFLTRRSGFSVHINEASQSMVPMAIIEIPPPSDVTASMLKGDLDTSPFEGLLARPEEPVGVPSLFYSPVMAQLIISQLLTSLASAIEFSDMVRLVNEAFQCLSGFNLDLRQAYDRLFHLLCLRRRLLM